jgi:hypothetical protein
MRTTSYHFRRRELRNLWVNDAYMSDRTSEKGSRRHDEVISIDACGREKGKEEVRVQNCAVQIDY